MKKSVKVVLTSSLALSTIFSSTYIGSSHYVKAEQAVPVQVTSGETINEMDRMKDSFKEYLAGGETINQSSLLDSKINNVHRTAEIRLSGFLPENERNNALFDGVILGENEGNLSNSFRNLYDIALATKSYKKESLSGANLYENKDAITKVIDGLEWLYTNFYENQDTGYYGNWYAWEIGMPMHITKTLLLLEKEINQQNPELIQNYVTSMDQYLRNGKNGDIDLDSRFHTGANLADIATNRIIQGALLDDEERVTTAVSNILTVFKTIDPNNIVHGNTDGYYEDGSFIQHHRVAYTGSYGKVLLNKVMQTMKILDGSKYDQKEILAPTVQEWIYKGFAPVIFEGYMMEIVKGRAVARTGTGYQDVIAVVEAMVQLSNYLNEVDSNQLKSHIKYVVNSMKASVTTNSFSSYETIIQFNNIMNDETVVAKQGNEANSHYAYNSMEKTVHLRDTYAFAVSRSSERISKYEYMNGENLLPWFQGDGAYYLYLSGMNQTDAFGVDYFATISPYQLPGTTVPKEERQSIPELYGEFFYENREHPLDFYASSESQNDYVYFPVGTNKFSGGVQLGKYGVAGIQLGDEMAYQDKQNGLLPEDFVVYKNADANKSFFMFDDEIVLLGSGIKDELGREVQTTIDNRMFDPDEVSEIKGETYGGDALTNPMNGSYNLKWVNFSTNSSGNQVGYYFPGDTSEVTIAQDTVTENLRKVRTRNPNREVTKSHFKLGIDHGENPDSDTYAYVILPNVDELETESYANDPAIKIVANSNEVHAVEHTKLGLKGINFFGDKRQSIEGITSFNPASVMIQQEGDTVTVAISDPTFNLKKMKLEIEVPDPKVITASKDVKVSVSRKKALIHIDSENAYGKSFEVQFRLNERKAN